MMSNKKVQDAMEAMDSLKTATAMIIGMRQQLTDAGWSAQHAEEMIIEMFKAGNKT